MGMTETYGEEQPYGKKYSKEINTVYRYGYICGRKLAF